MTLPQSLPSIENPEDYYFIEEGLFILRLGDEVEYWEENSGEWVWQEIDPQHIGTEYLAFANNVRRKNYNKPVGITGTWG